MVTFLGARAIGYKNVRVVARLPRTPDSPASARLQLLDPDSQIPFEEWDVREAWWD